MSAISYVVVTDTFDTIRDVVRAVAVQTVRADIELIIVCPSRQELRLEDDAVAGIGAVKVVEVGPVIPLSPPRAAGIRAATCEFVFIGETHSFPAPDCLERILAAHTSGTYAAVSPVIENANPQKALSWAALMLTYRHWIAPAAREEIGVLATYNACFRRELLLGFGDQLDRMLDYGSGLDQDLRARGGRLLMEPAARLGHLNVAALGGWLPERFLSGRFWAVARARRWTPGRRLLYTVASPLIPFAIAGRALKSKQWAHHRGRMPRGTLGALVVSAIATAVGEVAGYVGGGGDTPVRLAEYELHRARYL